MLAPPEREPLDPMPEPLRQSLLEFIFWIGSTGVGLTIYLWAFTHWLWLVVHDGLHHIS